MERGRSDCREARGIEATGESITGGDGEGPSRSRQAGGSQGTGPSVIRAARSLSKKERGLHRREGGALREGPRKGPFRFR